MQRPAVAEQDAYIISEETSETSMYGMNYYKKVSYRLPHTWRVIVMEMYNYKTICGGIEERTKN